MARKRVCGKMGVCGCRKNTNRNIADGIVILFELECVFLESFQADADISFKFVFLVLTVDIDGGNTLVDVLKDV